VQQALFRPAFSQIGNLLLLDRRSEHGGWTAFIFGDELVNDWNARRNMQGETELLAMASSGTILPACTSRSRERTFC